MASRISREMVVRVPVDRFYDLVVDYERYPEFVPSVRGCKVVHVAKGHRDVEYRVDLGVRTIQYVLRHIEVRPEKVTWSLVKGDMMKVSSGAWELMPHAGNTLARYTVEVQVTKPPLIPQAVVDRVSDELTKVQLPRTLEAFRARAEAGLP
ncbi:MAG TPA: SRPBCC family protein [Anaeromyxobacteraceae bacterium]|nr:SRPBCC family protein [Anaeromyxobacteraceae bacterium]